MLVKMVKSLENKTKKMQESINKDLEELKNKYAQTAQFHEQYEKAKRQDTER